MASNELGNPDTLDRDGEGTDAGVFEEGIGGVFRPHSGVLRGQGSREVPQTKPMGSVSDAAIVEHVGKRKTEVRKSRVSIVEPDDAVPPLRLDDPITEERNVPLGVPLPSRPYDEAETIRTESGPAVEWREPRRAGVLPILVVLFLVLIGVVFLLTAGPTDVGDEPTDSVARSGRESSAQATPPEFGVERSTAAKVEQTPAAKVEPPPAAKVEPAPVAKVAPAPVAEPKPAPTPRVARNPKPAPKPAPADPETTTAVTIHADPPTATLSIDGRSVGLGPYLGSFEPGAIVMVEGKAPGYATTFRAIKVGDQSSSVVVKLLPE